jgi:predicted O-methyltransferase YrrM
MDQAVAPTPHITLIETSDSPSLAQHVRSAFEDALAGRGSMDERVGKVDGFCGQKHRLFFNNLIRAVENPRYLEVGIFRGATLCAAIAGNKVRATGIDNWSEFGGRANELYANLAAIKPASATVTVLEQDFRTVDFSHIGKFNLYFYDGSHEEADQYDGVRMALPALDDQAVILVDDWNWWQVRSGTRNALRDGGARIDFSIEVMTNLNGSLPDFHGGGSDWHNGMFAAVVTKG